MHNISIFYIKGMDSVDFEYLFWEIKKLLSQMWIITIFYNNSYNNL